MVRARRRRIFTDPFWAAVAAGLLTLAFYLLAGIVSQFSPRLPADPVTLAAVWILGTCVLVALFVWRDMSDIREGVELDESSLHLFGKVILIPSIRRAAVVSFPSSTREFGPVLAIDYDSGGDARATIRTRFLHRSFTKDMLGLTNAIRALKGWLPQWETFSCRWKDWKTSRGDPNVPQRK